MPRLTRRAIARGEKIGEERDIEIGVQREIEIGAQQGAANETLQLLLRLGRKRLGAPTEATQALVAAIQNRDWLELLCERILDVETWEDLLAEA